MGTGFSCPSARMAASNRGPSSAAGAAVQQDHVGGRGPGVLAASVQELKCLRHVPDQRPTRHNRAICRMTRMVSPAASRSLSTRRTSKKTLPLPLFIPCKLNVQRRHVCFLVE